MRTLDEALDALGSRGDEVAFRRRTEFRSFPLGARAARDRALRIAAVLRTMGVGRGDRVVLRGPNGPDWGLSLLAILRLGAVAVPLDARASLDFTRRVAERTRARAAVASRLGAPVPDGLPALLFEEIDARLAAEKGPDPGPSGNSPDDIAEILFTSGTTGEPKGVVLTHGNIASNAIACAELARIEGGGRGDAFLSMLPMSHMFEQTTGFFLPVLGGARVVYLDALKPSAIVRALREERITVAVLVPRILKGLQQGIERETESGLRGAWFKTAWAAAGPLPTGGRRAVFGPIHGKFGGRVRFFFCGGAPLEPETENFWERLGFPILQGWGLTETSPVLACARPDARRAGSVGKFIDGVEHRLTPQGEVLVRGPGVFKGYLDDPARTAEVFEDGWFKTGDLAEIRDGFVYLKGRSKDLIKTPGGLNVYPEDVEAALRAVDGVRDACVFPLKGEKGEEVAAALLPWPGRALDPRAVAAAANAKLEEGRGVARAFVWPGEDFPRTPTMKVRKFQVREAIAAGGATDAAVAGATGDDPLLALLAKQVRRPPGEIEGTHRLGADLGLDSLDLVDLVSSAEELFRMDIDEGEVGPATTVDQLRALVKARKPVDDAGLPAWPRTWWGEAGRRLFRGAVLFPLFRFFARDEVSGLEHLPPAGTPVIYAPNHLSHLDTPAILDALPPALRRRTGAAAWKEYWEPPGAGFLKRAFLASLRTLLLMVLPLVPIAQTKGWRRSLRGVGTMLDAGWSLIFFPEGERSRSGVRLPFRAGIGVVAGAMRAPVVPVFVDGFHSILPRDAFWPRRGGGRVIFGKPLSFPADADPEQVARAVEKAVDALGVVPGATAAATAGPPPPPARP